MTDYEKTALFEIRSLIWKELTDAGLLNEQNYYADGFLKPLIPIIPTQQIPEFTNLLPGVPYITYDISVRPYQQNWWISEEILILNIISTDALQIHSIINLLIDVFRRFDKSATDMNLYKELNSNFNYHYFMIENATPTQAFDHEGGFMVGEVSIMYEYSRNINLSTGKFE